jgi:hypothetical protein
MEALLIWLGRAVGSGGLLACVVAVLTRLAGKHYLAGFELLTLLQGGWRRWSPAASCCSWRSADAAGLAGGSLPGR